MDLKSIQLKVAESLYLSSYGRRVQSSVHKLLFYREQELFTKFCRENANKSIISIYAPYIYFVEHIRDFWDALKYNQNLSAFYLGGTMFPFRKHKVQALNYFKTRYGYEINRDIFAYPWLKGSPTKLVLELSINEYVLDKKIPRVLYAHGMAGTNYSKDLKHVLKVQNHRAQFLIGPQHKRAILIGHKLFGGKPPELIEIGFLRGDRLLKTQESFDKKEYRKKNELNDSPIVLFVPTWGFFSALDDWFDRVVKLGIDEGFNLMLRLHPLTTVGKNGKIWEQKIKSVSEKYPNVRYVVSADLDELMLASDAMITDVSGMALEYMTLDKPVVFLPAPKYFELYGDERPEKWIRPGGDAIDYDDLKKKVCAALSQRSAGIDINELVYNRGKALPTMLDSIENLVL